MFAPGIMESASKNALNCGLAQLQYVYLSGSQRSPTGTNAAVLVYFG